MTIATTIDGAWASKKGRLMIERELYLLSVGKAHGDGFCLGLIEAFTAINALSESQRFEYSHQLGNTLRQLKTAGTDVA